MQECVSRLNREDAEWALIFWEERFWMTRHMELPALKSALLELDPNHFASSRRQPTGAAL